MNSTERPEHGRAQSAERGADAGTDPVGNRPMSTDEIRAAYADYADAFRRFERFDRLFVGGYRERQFGDAEGRVLDVACGTGTNFPYLPGTVDLVGVDISPEMLAGARDRLADLELDGTVRRMDAQNLDFPDDSFDTVISALSTCTFPDPVAALREMERVCDPDGRILLVEHGRSSVGPVARFQEWRADAHYETAGCRWTQEPLAVVDEAGLTVRRADSGFLGMITTVEAVPE
ncbi:class I SAM-dependent methyltransferase [Halostella salina]|uniref:class I SAM-dependent methyltransferase n=1 Tax=Halostella salina TaxID=1547897 RepID=UPI001F08C38E|nr:class I SAM-dependent methyltransferase [Halostella salina]